MTEPLVSTSVPCVPKISHRVPLGLAGTVVHRNGRYYSFPTLDGKITAAIADSPSLPRRELAEALAIAEQFQFPVRVLQTREFQNAEYLANPTNRCYFCKHELFTELPPLAKAEGFAVIAYGENASDIGDFRPGSQAEGADGAVRYRPVT